MDREKDSANLKIKFHLVAPTDQKTIALIAEWYFQQWDIAPFKTIEKLSSFSGTEQFQMLMTADDEPIATGGLYHQVGLSIKQPQFAVYKNWLAQVYTLPDWRHRGLGAQLCLHIQEHARNSGVTEMYLFTDTAESLYTRLGWTPIERVQYGERDIVVMRRELTT